MRRVVAGTGGSGVGAGGNDGGQRLRGTLAEKNWGGRIVHLNVKLITCKYNANHMQMSTGFLWVHSSGILFLGLRIGANLHPVACPVPSLLFIFSEGELKVSLVKGGEEVKVRLVLWTLSRKGGVTPRNGNIRKNDRPSGSEGAEWLGSWALAELVGVREAEAHSGGRKTERDRSP